MTRAPSPPRWVVVAYNKRGEVVGKRFQVASMAQAQALLRELLKWGEVSVCEASALYLSPMQMREAAERRARGLPPPNKTIEWWSRVPSRCRPLHEPHGWLYCNNREPGNELLDLYECDLASPRYNHGLYVGLPGEHCPWCDDERVLGYA